MTRVIIRFKDGTTSNIVADAIIVVDDGYIQIWQGEDRLVGIFFFPGLSAIYLIDTKKE
jgi:hypothetical protein